MIEEITEYLKGTCESLDHVLYIHGLEFDDLTDSDFSYLDQEIMCCESCNWWVDSYEIDGNDFCEDCSV